MGLREGAYWKPESRRRGEVAGGGVLRAFTVGINIPILIQTLGIHQMYESRILTSLSSVSMFLNGIVLLTNKSCEQLFYLTLGQPSYFL